MEGVETDSPGLTHWLWQWSWLKHSSLARCCLDY